MKQRHAYVKTVSILAMAIFRKIQIIVIIVRKIKGSDEIIQNSRYEMSLHNRCILKKNINKEQLLHFLLKNLNSFYNNKV